MPSFLWVQRSWRMYLIPLTLTVMDTSHSTSSPQALVGFIAHFRFQHSYSSQQGLFCPPKLPFFFSFFIGAFLFGRRISVEECMWEKNPSKSQPEVLYQSQWEEGAPKEDEDEDKDEEEKHFCMLMDNLGANSVFEKWVLFYFVCPCSTSLCCKVYFISLCNLLFFCFYF